MSRYVGLFRLFPIPNSSADGFVIHDIEVIKNSILTILHTHKGSRVYDPDFGTNLHKLIFELNIQRTRNIAKAEITNAIAKYEPRAEIISVDTLIGKNENAHIVTILVKVKYIEYDIEEELQMRLVGEANWISEEGTFYDPIQEELLKRVL